LALPGSRARVHEEPGAETRIRERGGERRILHDDLQAPAADVSRRPAAAERQPVARDGDVECPGGDGNDGDEDGGERETAHAGANAPDGRDVKTNCRPWPP